MAGPGLDHVVHCVHDLDAARERFAALGFTLTPPATHPFGTGNSLVQMGRSFLELLAVVDAERIPPHGRRSFSFGAWNRDFLARGREGMSMLVLSSTDARADEARWREAGVRTYEPVYFERAARQPDGSEATVAFTIAFAGDDALPGAVFFACEQHAPEHFWQDAYRRHANGARDLDSVTLVAREPARHADFLSTLAGAPARSTAHGIAVPTALGVIEVVRPDALGARFPGVEGVHGDGEGRFVAAAVAVADLDAARVCLERAGVRAVSGEDRVTVAPGEAFGLALELVRRRP